MNHHAAMLPHGRDWRPCPGVVGRRRGWTLLGVNVPTTPAWIIKKAGWIPRPTTADGRDTRRWAAKPPIRGGSTFSLHGVEASSLRPTSSPRRRRSGYAAVADQAAPPARLDSRLRGNDGGDGEAALKVETALPPVNARSRWNGGRSPSRRAKLQAVTKLVQLRAVSMTIGRRHSPSLPSWHGDIFGHPILNANGPPGTRRAGRVTSRHRTISRGSIPGSPQHICRDDRPRSRSSGGRPRSASACRHARRPRYARTHRAGRRRAG